MRESTVEAYLLSKVKAAGGQTRKVEWVGRRSAPDRYVMLPGRRPFWVECKNPDTIKAFPANGHEKLQALEHEIMRGYGAEVWVIGTHKEVDKLIDTPPRNPGELARQEENNV